MLCVCDIWSQKKENTCDVCSQKSYMWCSITEIVPHKKCCDELCTRVLRKRRKAPSWSIWSSWSRKAPSCSRRSPRRVSRSSFGSCCSCSWPRWSHKKGGWGSRMWKVREDIHKIQWGECCDKWTFVVPHNISYWPADQTNDRYSVTECAVVEATEMLFNWNVVQLKCCSTEILFNWNLVQLKGLISWTDLTPADQLNRPQSS